MAIRDRVFHDYVRSYVDAIEATRYADLDELQPAPLATLSQGGAGTAYVLWRLGRTRLARTWVTAALADRRASAWGTTDPNETLPRTSFIFGRGGLRWVQALLGGADRKRAIQAFSRWARSTDQLEYANGHAGYLLGMLVLLRQTRDPALSRAAKVCAGRLAAGVITRSATPWRPIDAMGFAHNWPGMLYAMLAWSQFVAEPPAPWLIDSIARLASAWSPQLTIASSMGGSWCNGTAGTALLWCKACEVTGDDSFRQHARVAVNRALEFAGVTPSVCCGDGGLAFAALCLDRIDPDAGWRERARQLAARLVGVHTIWPNGLFQGHPGFVCLALDCVGESSRGFPAIEG